MGWDLAEARLRALALAVPFLVAACGGSDLSETPSSANVSTASAKTESPSAPSPSDSAWASLIQELSEAGGYFDTDNLISNETSYLHVMGALDRLGVRGGAYVGVGPDQNFSYMARVRPRVAFIIDIRRDNLLQQLLFKALFEAADDRAEYLALLLGREPPDGGRADWDVEELVERVGAVPPDPDRAEEAVALVRDRVESFGLPLTGTDLDTVERFHRTFIREGLELRFRTHGRSPRFFYPTLRELLLGRDLEGRRVSYLAREDDFRFLKEMQEENRVVPVVGDLGGPRALEAVGREVRRRGLTVSAFYTSNVEFYLMRGAGFRSFAETVVRLPRNRSSVIIRSCFNRCAAVHPRAVEGHHSVQLLQRIEDFAEAWSDGGFDGYWDLVTRESLPLK